MSLDDVPSSFTGTRPDPRTRLRLADFALWQKMLLFALAFLICAEMGSYLSAPGTIYVSFWLPSGLAVGVLLLNPSRDWPWLLLALLPASVLFEYFHGTKPIGLIPVFYLANVVHASLGAWLVRRCVAARPVVATLKEFFWLMTLAGGLSAIPSTCIGVGALAWFGLTPSFAHSFMPWWGSTTMAVLVFTPFILTWFPNPLGLRDVFYFRDRLGEAVLLVLSLNVYLAFLFLWDKGAFSQYRSLLILFLLWAGLRFGRRGATAVCLYVAILLSFFTAQFGTGLTHAEYATGEYVFVLQSMLAMAVFVSLVPAIVLNERDQTLLHLRDSEERFRQLTQAAFEGICLSENGRITDANDQLLKMFGYERHEMIGCEVITLVAPEYHAAVTEAIRLRREPPYEQRLQRKDGSYFNAEVRVKLVLIGTRVIRMTALRDVSERKRAESERAQAESRERQARLDYTLQLIAYQEAERTRIAAELHDSLGQNLLLIKNRAQLALLENKLDDSAREQVEAIGTLATQAIAEARHISYDLHPYQLDHLGLTHALEAMIDHARESSAIIFQYQLDNVDQLFSKDQALNLYRVVQESLNNILKHSRAKNARVCLEHDVHEVLLQIEDDGQGYAAATRTESAPGFGLKNINARARMLDGRLTIESTSGHGTRLTLAIPIAEMSDE